MPSLASNDSSFSTAIPKQTDKSPQQNCRPVATERKAGLKEAFRAIERQQCWRFRPDGYGELIGSSRCYVAIELRRGGVDR
jgi:hypothetical protein